MQLNPKFAGLRRLVVLVFSLGAVGYLFVSLPVSKQVERRMQELSVENREHKRRSELLIFRADDTEVNSKVAAYLAPIPEVSPDGGFYPVPISIDVTNGSTGIVRYTQDGSIPHVRSTKFISPFRVKRTSVLRFRAYRPGMMPSQVVTQSYFVGENMSLPAVSLVIDPVNLWNKRTGLFHKPFGNFPRPKANLEYYLRGFPRATLSLPGEAELHGGHSRFGDKKSFRFIFPTKLVVGSDVGNAFTAKSWTPSRSVVLRCGGNNYRWRLGDELFSLLYLDIDENALELAPRLASDFEPYHHFLNGKYWGIYNIRERIDQDFLRRRLGGGRFDIISVESEAVVKAGTLEKWRQLVDFFNRNDLSFDSAYDEALQQIDIYSLVDYWIYNIYGSNLDWPWHNIIFVRKREESARWYCVSWDADQSFGLANPAFNDGSHLLGYSLDMFDAAFGLRALPNAGGLGEGLEVSTLPMRSFLKNAHFRKLFVVRFCDLLNTSLRQDRIESKLERLAKRVESDVNRDLLRWKVSREMYEGVQAHIRLFARKRGTVVRAHLRRRFGLGEASEIAVDVLPSGAGRVRIGTIQPLSFPWRGIYFEGMTLGFQALPYQGFAFEDWEASGIENFDATRAVTGGILAKSGRLIARFKRL